jgi:hypothetical protein
MIKYIISAINSHFKNMHIYKNAKIQKCRQQTFWSLLWGFAFVLRMSKDEGI